VKKGGFNFKRTLSPGTFISGVGYIQYGVSGPAFSKSGHAKKDFYLT